MQSNRLELLNIVILKSFKPILHKFHSPNAFSRNKKIAYDISPLKFDFLA